MRAMQISTGLGAGNIGDDLMARAFWDNLPVGMSLEVSVFPEAARSKEGYPSAHHYSAVEWDRNECRAVRNLPALLVGGTPVSDAEGAHWPLEFLAKRLQHFHNLGQPVDALGVGVDAHLSLQGRRLFHQHFQQIRSWTVRSNSCLQALISHGVPASRIRVGADWGWLYQSPYDLRSWARAYWRKLRVSPDHPLLVVSCVSMQWEDAPAEKRALASALDWVSGHLGLQIAFFCNECRSGSFFDFSAALEVMAFMRAPALVVPNEYYSPAEAIALLACATATLGQRYHFILESVLAGSVPVAVLRGEKMQGLAHELSIPIAGRLGSLDKEAIIFAIQWALECRPTFLRHLAKIRTSLRRRAQENLVFIRSSAPYADAQWEQHARDPNADDTESDQWIPPFDKGEQDMHSSGHLDSLDSLTTGILRAKRHQGGLKMWPCLELEGSWFAEIQEEVKRLMDRREASYSSLPSHPSNWSGVVGLAAQHSLFNSSGNTADYGSDFNSQSERKTFADSESPAMRRLVTCFEDRLHNFRINTFYPHSGVKPHEEPIVKDNLICLRFHLPVLTNERATIILDGQRFHFEPGVIYFFNKGCIHAAENEGEEPRCHFLFDLWLDEWVFENLFSRDSRSTPDPGLRRLEPGRESHLCASTPVEITEYMHGTASCAILRGTRRPGGDVYDKLPVNFDPDIVPPDESIALSGEWHPLEHWDGNTFRWVSGSAALNLLALEDGMEPIEVELEPGPGIEVLPAQVEVVDRDGCQILTADVHGRQTLQLSIPVHAGPLNQFRMVARNGGRRLDSDPRILDFRIFRVDRAQTAAPEPVLIDSLRVML